MVKVCTNIPAQFDLDLPLRDIGPSKNPAARVVAPARTVRPCWQRTNQQQNKYDDQDRGHRGSSSFDPLAEVAYARAGAATRVQPVFIVDRSVCARFATAEQADDRRNREQDDCDEENDLRQFDRDDGDTAEAEKRGDQRYQKERNGPTKHGILLDKTINGRTRA